MTGGRALSSRGQSGDADGALRANTYRLLAALLAAPPDQGLLRTLEGVEQGEQEEDAPLALAWRTLALAAHSTTVDAVDDEYHALFIGVTRGEVMPYASWYLTGFVMERPLAELRQDLKQLGYARSADVKEPEDHAAALCETMGLLILDADVGAGREKKFFDDHVGPWMIRFFQDLQEAENAEFYSAVGMLGEKFLRVDQQYLAMTPN